jgi:mercuric ion transport protein
MKQLGGKSALVAGMLAAIAASVCCVGPLVLFVLGIGGAWASNMTALEPYRPIFICLTCFFWDGLFASYTWYPRFALRVRLAPIHAR